MSSNKRLIIVLVFIIILLLGVIGYLFLIKPSINGLVVQGRNQGYAYAIYSLMQQASACQPIPLYFENQTVTVIAVECLQNPPD